MTLGKHSDWRGSSTKFPEGKYLVDPMTEIRDRSSKLCEIVSQSGSVRCRFLSSALLQWQTFIHRVVEVRGSVKGMNLDSLKTGVAQGHLIGVKIIAGCQECKRHSTLSMTLLTEWLTGLLWKNLGLRLPAATFILWRLEIGNTYQSGQWGTFD